MQTEIAKTLKHEVDVLSPKKQQQQQMQMQQEQQLQQQQQEIAYVNITILLRNRKCVSKTKKVTVLTRHLGRLMVEEKRSHKRVVDDLVVKHGEMMIAEKQKMGKEQVGGGV